MTLRTVTELYQIRTFNERFDYLSMTGLVGDRTFGGERYLNQRFYTSHEWRDIRYDVISRDEGCDLGVPGFELYERIIVHHINPLTPEDIEQGSDALLDLENLITCSHITHNALHYGGKAKLPMQIVERRPNDTQEW